MNPLFTFPVIETARMRLRQPKMEDADAVFQYRAREDFSDVARVPRFREKWEAQTHVFTTLASYYQQKKITWFIELLSGSSVIGSVSLIAMKDDTIGGAHRLEVSSELAADYRGQGLIPEAKKAAILWAFATFDRLKRIHSEVAVSNKASVRANEKLGFRRDGVLRSFEEHDGDVIVMSLLRGEVVA